MANRVRVSTHAERYSEIDELRRILRERWESWGSERGKKTQFAKDCNIEMRQLKRTIYGKGRFNEDQLNIIAEVAKIPIRVGAPPPPGITVQSYPDSAGKADPDFVLVRVVDQRTLAEKPLSITEESILEWAYMHRRSFQAFNVNNMVATYIRIETDRPLVRKEMMVCVSTDTRPKEGKIPPGSVWAARKDGAIVIGNIKAEDGKVALRRDVPFSADWQWLNSMDDIVGRVCWTWHSMI